MIHAQINQQSRNRKSSLWLGNTILAEQAFMHHSDKTGRAVDLVSSEFEETFAFAMENGLHKTVTVSRSGRNFKVVTDYLDGAVSDASIDTFEADGPVRISVTESGLYLASSRILLVDRVQLRRTRFF